MNTAGFATPFPSAAAQLWAVLKEFHVGEFLKDVFDRHHIKRAGVARALDVSPQSISNIFDQVDVGDERLIRLSRATGLDLLGMVRRERLKRQGIEPELAIASEPAPSYGRPSAMDLTVHMDDYDEATQLKILRFLQQLPKRR